MERYHTSISNTHPLLSILSINRNVDVPSSNSKNQNSCHPITLKYSKLDELEKDSTTRLSPSNSYSTGLPSNITKLGLDYILVSTEFLIAYKLFIKRTQSCHCSTTLTYSRPDSFEE